MLAERSDSGDLSGVVDGSVESEAFPGTNGKEQGGAEFIGCVSDVLLHATDFAVVVRGVHGLEHRVVR